MGNKIKKDENYLEKIPVRKESVEWTADEKGIVTINIHNKGLFNFIAQKLFKKPKISYIHLEENGSFIWLCIDGEKNLIEIGKLVDEKFGDAAHPLYERLAKYIQMLENYGFIELR